MLLSQLDCSFPAYFYTQPMATGPGFYDNLCPSRGRMAPPPPSPSRTPTSRPSTAPATKLHALLSLPGDAGVLLRRCRADLVTKGCSSAQLLGCASSCRALCQPSPTSAQIL